MATTKSKKRKLFKLLAPQAESVYLAASFNDWDPHARPLKKDARGLWKTSVTLPLGKHEYRFVVDGEWRDDPRCEEHHPNPFGTTNCILHT